MEAYSSDFSRLTDDIARLTAAEHPDPFSVLGLHAEPDDQGQSVRVFHPGARGVRVLVGERIVTLSALAPGFFAGLITRAQKRPAYRLQIETQNGVFTGEDPYRFGLVISADDAISLKAGRCWHAHRVLGAHQTHLDGVQGISFAVWAPTAKRVCVVGDWNTWDPAFRPMRFRHEIGVWELFEPDLAPGASYAFDILSAEGCRLRKRDPYARAVSAEGIGTVPAAANAGTPWTDADWLAQRPQREEKRGFAAIYRLSAEALGPEGQALAHFGQKWCRGFVPENAQIQSIIASNPGKFGSDFPDDAIDGVLEHIQEQGGTHLCLMHAWTAQPNAPPEAAPRNWLAPASGWGAMPGLQRLIDRAHAHGLGVLIDWPIDAFSGEPEGLARFDGSALYENADPARAITDDGTFRRFNYARYECANFLLSAALFWLEDMHVDGLALRGVNEALRYHADAGKRGTVDAAGVDFLRRLTELIAACAPGAMVLSDADCFWPGITAPTWAGGLGCAHTASAHWIGWQGDGAARTLAMLGLSEASPVLAFDDWQAAHGYCAPLHESQLAALIMGMLPGWKLWPDFPAACAGDGAEMRALVAAINQAKPQGRLGLLTYPDAQQDLLAFTRGESWLCAANLSATKTKNSCPAPGAGDYQIIARNARTKTRSPARITARAAPDTATGWLLPLDLPPRSALAMQRIEAAERMDYLQ